ncbi:MAG TPA: HYR domain-containing protein [Verrucomicrobiae bacterium]
MRAKQILTVGVTAMACWLAGPPSADAALTAALQGQNRGTNVWTTQNLLGWRELDFIPLRTFFTGGPASNQVVIVEFDHTRSSGTTRGIENLTSFTHSTNVVITSGPTLSAPVGIDIWSYAYTITVTNAQPAFVEFRGRLAAGSHVFPGNSLNLKSFLNSGPFGNLGIFKAAAGPGTPDLAIAKVGASQAAPGDIIAYAINYTNQVDTTNIAIGAQVTDVLPTGLSYVPGSASANGTLVGNTLTWDLADLTNGARGSLTYKVMVSTNIAFTQTLVNFAQLLSAQNDLNPADNLAQFTTTVVAAPTPVAIDDSYSVLRNTPLIVAAPGVLTNDFDNASNSLMAVLFSSTTNGTLALNTNGSFTYTPTLDFVGNDTFTYRASNATNASGPAVVTINVTNACSLTVTTTNDSGPGSLREVINCANSTPGLDTIRFNIPGTGVQTITPLSQLPTITDPVIIDGYTQPGASPNQLPDADNAVALIELDGSLSAGATGLNISAGGSTIRGLVINRFGNGIVLSAAGGNVIEGNLIGTDPTGSLDRGNGGAGVNVSGGSGNLIGGTTPAARNVISGNTGNGIGITASGTLVRGNFIGTDKDGTSRLPNAQGIGISVGGHDAVIGGNDADDGTIDGGVGARNVISGNDNMGIIIDTSGNGALGAVTIQGNFIGLNAAGSAAIGNLVDGINNDARGRTGITTVGGTAAGAGNFISGNGGRGIFNNQPGVIVQGNSIGTDASGTVAFGNAGNGIDGGANNVTIGGPVAGAGNTIAHNGQNGVLASGLQNSILGNSIFANAALGIDLGGGGVTPNDPGDTDTGPNNLQNFPVLNSVASVGSNVVIQGTLNSVANGAYRLEFFANTACDVSGFGEGQFFLGATNVTTDAGGDASFTVTLPGIGTPFFSATATDTNGNTSEFSACFSPCTIMCPPNITATNSSGQCGAVVTYPAPTTIGTCGTVTCTPASGSFFAVGTNIVMCSNGFGSSCSFTVTVLDQESPTISCPADIVLSADPGQCSRSNVTYTVTPNDNCPGFNLVQNAGLPSGSTFARGTTTNTFTVSDASGNFRSCSFTVTINDGEAPTFSALTNLVLTTDPGQCSHSNVTFSVSATDNCTAASNIVITCVPPSGSTFQKGVTTVTCMATDESSNTSSSSFTVTIQDKEPPVLSCPANIVTNTAPGQSNAVVNFLAPAFSDNCSGASGIAQLASCSPTSGSTFLAGVTTVTCTATDSSGNSNSCTFTVTVIATPAADLSLTKTAAPNPVTVGSNFTYTIVVTNSGPNIATGVTVTDPLPASVAYVSSASSQGACVASNGIVTCDLGGLTNGTSATVTIVVTPAAAGSITNTATVTAAEFDPNSTNSVATDVTVVVPAGGVSAEFLTGITFNLQTGLFEQKVNLTNSGATITNATRVYVHGLPAATNLYNASGVSNGLPFVQYNLPLLSASNVVFLLEYYFANGVPATNLTLTAEEVAAATPPTIPSNAVFVALEVGRAPLPLTNLNNGRFLIEWEAIPGRTYTIQYTTNLLATNWATVVPSIVAPANRVQWLDDGPPKTESKPGVSPARFYRVFLLPLP